MGQEGRSDTSSGEDPPKPVALSEEDKQSESEGNQTGDEDTQSSDKDQGQPREGTRRGVRLTPDLEESWILV